jgi:catechol-2,3-dioxygenase
MADTKSPADARGFSVRGPGEIAIRCRDLAVMAAFYRDIPGLPVLSARGGLSVIRLDNAT